MDPSDELSDLYLALILREMALLSERLEKFARAIPAFFPQENEQWRAEMHKAARPSMASQNSIIGVNHSLFPLAPLRS